MERRQFLQTALVADLVSPAALRAQSVEAVATLAGTTLEGQRYELNAE